MGGIYRNLQGLIWDDTCPAMIPWWSTECLPNAIMAAWQSSRHFATTPLISLRNGIWGTRAEILYWWCVTSQFWTVLLRGDLARSGSSDVSSVLNVFPRSLDVIPISSLSDPRLCTKGSRPLGTRLASCLYYFQGNFGLCKWIKFNLFFINYWTARAYR